jgi:hypothetical protein
MAYRRIAKSQRTARGLYLGQHDLLLTEPSTQTDNLEVPPGTGLLASSQVYNVVPSQLRNLASNGILDWPLIWQVTDWLRPLSLALFRPFWFLQFE